MIAPIIDIKVIDALRRKVEAARHIVITCHISPDGDAIGSSLALCRVLRNMGKDAQVVFPDQTPVALHFMPGLSETTTYTVSAVRARFLLRQADLLMCLDFNSLQRLDKFAPVVQSSNAYRVLIDHHLDPDNVFDLKISFPGLSSTCELVFRTVSQLGYARHIDKQAAQCLYVGMMTDTGNFTYSSEYPEIYEIVAQLVAKKIDKQRLYNQAMNTFSESSLRIQGYAMSEKMQVFPESGAALITLTGEELARYGYQKGDTEGLVNKPLAIPGVRWVAFFREDPERIKVSCRSEGDFSVSEICNKYFNGGGHKNAAGGEFVGTIDEAIAKFKQILDDNTEQ